MRFLKQFAYGIFYLACWAGIGYLLYLGFIKPAPSCVDGIRNQGEIGIDCGGPCSNACLPTDLRALTVSRQAVVLPIVGTSRASILAEVQNPNALYAAQSFDYLVTLYDASGNVAQTIKGSSFIYAGEIKMIALPNLSFDSGVIPMRAEMSVMNPKWIPLADFTKPDIAFQTQDTIMQDATLKTSGVIVNNDALSTPHVTVMAVYVDARGVVRGVSETELDDIASRATRAFTIFHPAFPDVNLPATKVFLSASRP